MCVLTSLQRESLRRAKSCDQWTDSCGYWLPGRCLADCPARVAVEIIADKWAVVVLYGLADKPRRHGELARLIGGISNKVLTHTLRRLQNSGLVTRRAYAEAPPKVEYELTELGRTLIDPIRMLAQWAETNGEAILDAQDNA